MAKAFNTIAILFGLFLAGWSSPAQAYQAVKVAAGGGTVFANPNSSSATTGMLKAGAVINIGDQPTNGYYRCSAAGGVSGWIAADQVVGAKKSQSGGRWPFFESGQQWELQQQEPEQRRRPAAVRGSHDRVWVDLFQFGHLLRGGWRI